MKRTLVPVFVVAALLSSGCGGRAARAQASGQESGQDSPSGSGLSASSTIATSAPTTTAAAGSDPASACAPTTTLTPGHNTIDVNGEQREFQLAVPAALDAHQPAPLILDFHGSGSDMDQEVAYSGMAPEGTARGYIVVTPQGTGSPRGWSLKGPGTDDAFVDAMLASIGSGTCLDRDRVFAVGISNGSAYAALMACREPRRLAAVGMVAATLVSLCPVDSPMPAVAFHGTKDPVVPYGGGNVNSQRTGTQTPGAEGAIAQWAQRNGCGATPEETKPADDVVHRVWTGCTNGASVQFFSIIGGGHTWPGSLDLAKTGKGYLGATTQSISATKVFLDFFDAVGTPTSG